MKIENIQEALDLLGKGDFALFVTPVMHESISQISRSSDGTYGEEQKHVLEATMDIPLGMEREKGYSEFYKLQTRLYSAKRILAELYRMRILDAVGVGLSYTSRKLRELHHEAVRKTCVHHHENINRRVYSEALIKKAGELILSQALYYEAPEFAASPIIFYCQRSEVAA